MATDLATVKEWLKQRVNEHEFRELLAASLLDLCRIDTIPAGNFPDTARREGQLLSLIEQLIHSHGLAGRLERRQKDSRNRVCRQRIGRERPYRHGGTVRQGHEAPGELCQAPQ